MRRKGGRERQWRGAPVRQEGQRGRRIERRSEKGEAEEGLRGRSSVAPPRLLLPLRPSGAAVDSSSCRRYRSKAQPPPPAPRGGGGGLLCVRRDVDTDSRFPSIRQRRNEKPSAEPVSRHHRQMRQSEETVSLPLSLSVSLVVSYTHTHTPQSQSYLYPLVWPLMAHRHAN